MKPLRLLVLVACLSVFCSMFSSAVFALESDEVRVSVALSTETPYKGSTVTVSIFFISDSEQELTISFYGVNFDWMESDKFAGHNISSEPITVAAHGSASLTPITVQIPENATIGPHTYYVGIDGEDESTNAFSWDSNTMTVVLQTSAQDAYDGLLSQVANGISDATEASYQSPDAQSLLDQAETSYSQAQNYGSRQQYDEAISALETASFYLDQAETEEQNYIPPKNDQDLLILVIAAAAFIVVIVLVLMLTRKRRQIPVVQPSEL